jgi:hypothetical protein
LASVIVLTLSTTEQGGIVVCAPSNVATDGIAEKMAEISRQYGLNRKILRVFSKTRENQFANIASYGSIKEAPNTISQYTILHEEVRKSSKWMKGDEMRGIANSNFIFYILYPIHVNNFTCLEINCGQEYLLTNQERDDLRDHINNLEMEIMEGFDIYVCTVGAIADMRINLWTRNNLSTILMDEAGQLTQPETLPIFMLEPKRFIAVGDQLQLKPTIFSYAAQIAGLDRSNMEWLSTDR